ncbi:MAG: hypothetical protein RLZZ414_103, partial [Bacteroidota bacterium]
AKLLSLIKNQTGCDINFPHDGGSQSIQIKENQIKNLAIKYLEFYNKNVYYFPTDLPEDMIWDEDVASQLLKLLKPNININEIIEKSNNSKDYLFNFCIECYGVSAQFESTILLFTQNWLNKEDKNFIYLKDFINKIKL